MLHKYQILFIKYYETIKKSLDTYNPVTRLMQVIFNLQMRLIVKTGADQLYRNLHTLIEVVILISNKYEEPGF